LGIQTAECPICENHDPCGTGVLDFCKVAFGGLIATLQNFRKNTNLDYGDDAAAPQQAAAPAGAIRKMLARAFIP
jgi:hypothetical protein